MALASIYYCDQDEDDQCLFTDLIKSISTNVSCTPYRDGEHALLDLARNTPDIIFSEVEIFPYSGLEFLKLLKSTKAFQHIPVIFYSSLISKDDACEYLRAGASEVINKLICFQASVKQFTRVLTTHCPSMHSLLAKPDSVQ